MNRSISLVDWGLLLTASVLVGSTFLFINIAVQEFSPLVIAAIRAIISALICWGVMRAYGAQLPRTLRGWRALFLLGLLTGAIPFGTVAWGRQHIESGMGGILFGTMPILAVVLAPLFLSEETFTRRALVGGLVGFAGIILLMGPCGAGQRWRPGPGYRGNLPRPLQPHPWCDLCQAPARSESKGDGNWLDDDRQRGACAASVCDGGTAQPHSRHGSDWRGARHGSLDRGRFLLLFLGHSAGWCHAQFAGTAVLPGSRNYPGCSGGWGERLPLEAFIGLALIMVGAFAVSTRKTAGTPVSATPSPQPQ